MKKDDPKYQAFVEAVTEVVTGVLTKRDEEKKKQEEEEKKKKVGFFDGLFD